MAGRCGRRSGGPCIGIRREERGHRRPRRRRRLCSSQQLHRARRNAHGVRTTAVMSCDPANRSGAWIHSTRRLVVDSNIKDMLLRTICFVVAAMAIVATVGIAVAEDNVDPTAVKSEDGKYLDKEGNPTFKVAPDGTVDWYTYSGYRRYHSECHVCHGPDAEGSTFAPPLKNSIKTMSYGEFLEVVASGRKNVSTSQENVMPAFGANPNVACYMDDLYVYLRARAYDAVGRGRPAKHEDKPPAARQAEDSCMGKR